MVEIMVLFLFVLLQLGRARHQKFRQEATNGWLILEAIVVLWCCKNSRQFIAHPCAGLRHSSDVLFSSFMQELLVKALQHCQASQVQIFTLIFDLIFELGQEEKTENIRTLEIVELKVKVASRMERDRHESNLKLQIPFQNLHFAIILTWISKE